ncbi:hypothetical protein BIV57_06370 [Mangrovactinospora gilvigrisea]|uniref:histidine kinase n=1 Tax=Mangrovactinospora gilvigrisea TaxID=1428644 RepID=A0A1J7C9T3_9ACTN|nr:nitrate- and nitrite sensing domain-containing protein [Mangrovactinospora gilvigrisea]OIV38288.1 hypothetical protein BIV57_06370 [Mangrovactinospora gilvigrisea]
MPRTQQNTAREPGRLSLRTALVVLALIPSLALISLLGVASGNLWNQWRALDGAARLAERAEPPAYSLMVALQQERRLSEVVLAGKHGARAQLKAQRVRTDNAADRLRAVASDATGPDAGNVPGTSARALAVTAAALGPLSGVRAQVDENAGNRGSAFDVYTSAIAADVALFNALGRTDDGGVTAAARPMVALFWGGEMLSREDALLTRAAASGRLTSDEYTQFAGWVGVQRFSYEQQAAPELPAGDRSVYDKVTTGGQWADKTSAEDAVIQSHLGGNSPGAAIQDETLTAWGRSIPTITDQMQKLAWSRSVGVQQTAKDASRTLLWRLVAITAVGLVGVVAAVLIVLRLTLMLRRRIAALRAEALDLQTRLPDVLERLRRGETIDTSQEIPEIRRTSDELGRLGDALNLARRTALQTAVEQAEQHRGFEKLLQRIARRTQLLIGLQLRKLDEMERRHENPEVLEGLFDLDHLTARLRRYEENLVILGGGQPQRRWRKPARLLDVLRSAQGEVQDYTRIQIDIEGSAWIHERAVGPVVHVLAELMENAASFSKPPTPVEVHASAVGRGVAVEIEDRGLGMEPGQYRAANAIMADPPAPDVLSRVDDIRLGLYVVARLASALDIQVEFRPSVYGGTRVIVLVPADLIVRRPPLEAAADPETDAGPERPRLPARQLAALPGGAGHHPEPAQERPGRAADPAPEPAPTAIAPAPPTPGPTRMPSPASAPVPARRPGSGRVLPKRVRQANIAPELRVDPDAPAPAPGPAASASIPAQRRFDGEETVDLRPESARRAGAAIGAFQRQSRRSRSTAPTPPPSNASAKAQSSTEEPEA